MTFDPAPAKEANRQDLTPALQGGEARAEAAILRAALDCFNTQGIEATTIEMISRRPATPRVGAISITHFGTTKKVWLRPCSFAAIAGSGGAA